MSNTAASRTKDLMIDVARQLFAKLGISNTTMNDIADKAQKGRRTIYTYFRSKADIITAIIQKELDTMADNLRAAKASKLRPENKLILFIYTHLESMKEIVERNGSLHAEFFSDIHLVERTRRSFDREEQIMIRDILDEGVVGGHFSIVNTNIAATVIMGSLKGLEVPYISGRIRNKTGEDFDEFRCTVEQMLLNGIRPPRGVRSKYLASESN
ncbi:MAG: TetR/AcrR family transcriptional regulator [Porphyromonas sp.]|nr:TetR/AcrR family transcriptional regulator [Porphyromonas sp.]